MLASRDRNRKQSGPKPVDAREDRIFITPSKLNILCPVHVKKC